MNIRKSPAFELFETLRSFMDTLWDEYQDEILKEIYIQESPSNQEETYDPQFNDDDIPF